METATTNPDHLEWTLATGMIEEFLPRSPWAEEVIQLAKGDPGDWLLAPVRGLTPRR